MKDYLLLIDSLLDQTLSFSDFSDHIGKLYLSQDGSYTKLKKEEREFLDEVFDRSEYTSNKLHPEERHWGLMDSIEYRDWLSKMKQENIYFWKKFT